MKNKKNNYDIFTGGKHHAEKYDKNLVHQWLVRGFMDCLVKFVLKTGKNAVFEVGCGEGQLLGVLYQQGIDVAGMDIDRDAIQISQKNFDIAGIGSGGYYLHKEICMI